MEPITPTHPVHHQLLEGVLLRLARLSDAQDWILRGGMLLRHWFRPIPRRATDLDLVATFPFDIDETARRFQPILSDQGVPDGVVLDSERFRVEGIWLNTSFPGVRIYACGQAQGTEVDFSIDVTFNEPLIPEPVADEYVTTCGTHSACLWMCRPETIVGRKLHALKYMGRLHWRAKDLNDLRLLLSRVPMCDDELPAAIVASFTSRGEPATNARKVFAGDSWWTMNRSAARWQEFVHRSGEMAVPSDLATVVAEVSQRLHPVLERLP